MGLLPKSFASFTSEYQPTGAFSLEFKKRGETEADERTLGEYFFLIGPMRYNHQYRYNLSVKNTYDGAVITDYGNGLSQIQLSGELNVFYSGVPPKNSKFGGLGESQDILGGNVPGKSGLGDAAASAGSNFAGKFGESLSDKSGLGGRQSGVKDFFDLMYLMWDSRSEEGFSIRKPLSKNLSGQGAGAIATAAISESVFDFETIKIIYHDYDRDSHWEIVLTPEGLAVSQQVNDPFTFVWNLNFIGVQDIIQKAKSLFISPLPSPASLVYGTQDILETTLETVQGPLVFASNVTNSVTQLKNVMDSMKGSVTAFVESSKDAVRNIRKFNKKLKESTQKTQGDIEKYYLPGIPDPFAYYSLANVNNLNLALDPNYVQLYDLYHVWSALGSAATTSGTKIISKDTDLIVIPSGLSWEGLSNKLFGTPTRAEELKIKSGILVAGKELSEFVGQKLKIPSKSKKAAKAYKTGVINEHKEEPNQKDIEDEVFGSDIGLTSTGDFFAGFDGDIGIISGLETLEDHLLDRVTKVQGTVPMHQGWGAAPVPGELGPEYTELVVPVKVMENIVQDPAVAEAEMLGITIDGDRFDMEVNIVPVSGFDPFKIQFPSIKVRAA